MFKLLAPKYFATAVAWVTVAILAVLNGVAPVLAHFGITPKTSWTILAVQGIVTLVVVTPLWRKVWRLVPALNRWVFPDLNGEWDVEGESNWDRILAMMEAAKGAKPSFDMATIPEDQLAPLMQTMMRARIVQNFASIRITLWNPHGKGPIKESKTLMVEPFRGEDGRHGLNYIFEQENVTAAVTDERTFMGAGRVVRDRDDENLLCGRMWTDRSWRRGLNTAADVRFRRRPACGND